MNNSEAIQQVIDNTRKVMRETDIEIIREAVAKHYNMLGVDVDDDGCVQIAKHDDDTYGWRGLNDIEMIVVTNTANRIAEQRAITPYPLETIMYQPTYEEFWQYENVRLDGKTNMADTEFVTNMSELSKETVLAIRENYSELSKLYEH